MCASPTEIESLRPLCLWFQAECHRDSFTQGEEQSTRVGLKGKEQEIAGHTAASEELQ